MNVFPPNERRVIRMRHCIIFSIHPLIRSSPNLLIPPSLYPLIRTSSFLTTTRLIGKIHCSKESYGFEQRQFNLYLTTSLRMFMLSSFISSTGQNCVFDLLINNHESGEQRPRLIWPLPLLCKEFRTLKYRQH